MFHKKKVTNLFVFKSIDSFIKDHLYRGHKTPYIGHLFLIHQTFIANQTSFVSIPLLFSLYRRNTGLKLKKYVEVRKIVGK